MSVFYFLKWKKERSVICCVAGAEKGSWGEERWAEMPGQDDCATSCCCHPSAVRFALHGQAAFKTGLHIPKGKALLQAIETYESAQY